MNAPYPPIQRQSARDWLPILREYRTPSLARSLWEIGVSISIFAIGWATAWVSLSNGVYWAWALSVIFIGMMLMRLFSLMHDCGHGAMFETWKANRWAARVLGVLCIAPAALWSKKHAVHHATHGNLDERGMGDVRVLTVEEYNALSPLKQRAYRAYRNPYFLLGVGPFYSFVMEYRMPFKLMAQRQYWQSAMGANLVIAAIVGAMYWIDGWAPILLILIPSVMIGGFAGVWAFYVQHQFEDVEWRKKDDWCVADASLYGSSYLVLPAWLNWFTCNIGIHHVHHLYSRIPFYRLPEVLKDHPALAQINRLTLLESARCLTLSLWDVQQQRLISFKEAASLRLL